MAKRTFRELIKAVTSICLSLGGLIAKGLGDAGTDSCFEGGVNMCPSHGD